MRKGHSELYARSIADLLYDQDSPGINWLWVHQTSYQLESKNSSTGLFWSVRALLTYRVSTKIFSILIHAPYGGKEARLGSWDALVEAQKEGKAKAIGVSNYGIHHLEELEEYIQAGGGGQIDVGQYELHPWLDHSDIVAWLQSRNIVVEAYSPLAHGSRLKEPVLASIGEKYGKTPAQVLIRWSLQMVSWFLYVQTQMLIF